MGLTIIKPSTKAGFFIYRRNKYKIKLVSESVVYITPNEHKYYEKVQVNTSLMELLVESNVFKKTN